MECIISYGNLPHFSPLPTDILVLTSLRIEGSEFGKTNVHHFFFLSPGELSTISGHFKRS